MIKLKNEKHIKQDTHAKQNTSCGKSKTNRKHNDPMHPGAKQNIQHIDAMLKQRNGHISTPRRPQKLSIGPFDAEFHDGALGTTPEA